VQIGFLFAAIGLIVGRKKCRRNHYHIKRLIWYGGYGGKTRQREMEMDYQDFQIALASIDPPSVFNFYPSVEAAEADKERANSREYSLGYTYTHVLTYDAYKAAEREFYLKRSEQEITAEKFEEMLNVLPPKHWRRGEWFESFLMIEHWSGVYTSQFVRRGTRYFTKLVDATDRTTWMTEAACVA
jgi:hypothetical protein